MNKIISLISREYSNCYVQQLYDPIQTHAVYGVKTKDQLVTIKSDLRSHGANCFRQVKVMAGFILCFKFPK